MKKKREAGIKRPVYKGEIRDAITIAVSKNKNSASLRDILTIVDVMLRAQDEELCKTLTDWEWNIRTIINSVLTCNEEQSAVLKVLVSRYVYG